MSDKKGKTFEPLFAKTKEKMGGNETIDFKGSDIDQKKKTVHIPAKSSLAEEKENRTCRHAVYLTPKENEEFLDTLKRLEKPGVKIRELILANTAEWKTINNK